MGNPITFCNEMSTCCREDYGVKEVLFVAGRYCAFLSIYLEQASLILIFEFISLMDSRMFSNEMVLIEWRQRVV